MKPGDACAPADVGDEKSAGYEVVPANWLVFEARWGELIEDA